MTMAERRPPPWSIEERQESFIVKDANGQQFAYLYFEDEPQRAMSMKGYLPALVDFFSLPPSSLGWRRGRWCCRRRRRPAGFR